MGQRFDQIVKWDSDGFNWYEVKFRVPDGASTLYTYAAVDGEQDLGSSDDSWDWARDGLPWGIHGGIQEGSWAVLVMFRNGVRLKTREDSQFGSYNFRFPSSFNPEPGAISAPKPGSEFSWKVGHANQFARQIGPVKMFVEVNR